MKKPVKVIIALVVVSFLTSFLSSESQSRNNTQKQPPKTVHIYEKLKCDSLEIEHRIKSINQILTTK